tara:strand:- start:10956 stop:11501 length:546 start_codon:yes stop_codon:yes gene_type:complete
LIRILYITAFLCSQLFASNELEYNISFEYWLSEDLKIFAVDDVIKLEVQDDAINVSSHSWFGEILLEENIKYNNQSFLQNSIFNKILFDKTISEEDSWIDGYSLLDDKTIKVRYLFSSTEDNLRLYRMDIKELNKDGDDNKINNVILNSDIMIVWTNLDKEIIKISLKYNGATYVLKLNEE